MKKDEYKMSQQVNTTNYKEKYEQALKVASQWHKDGIGDVKTIVECIFPELRESEDEKWRNWLIGHLKGYINQTDDKYAEVCKKAIAWLEKQGEPRVNMIQWKGDNLKEVVEFTGKSPKFGEWFKTWEEYENYVHSHGNIFKLFCEDGSHYEVPVSAWIVKTPDGYNIASKAKYKQKIEQKPAWSEEDERNLDWLMTVCERIHYKSDPQVAPDSALMLKDWLKSLRDRVLPKLAEWSEEDERTYSEILDFFLGNIGTRCATIDKQRHFGYWLKSLKPQNHWKPSEQNIKDLEWCADLVKDKMGVGFHRLQVLIDKLKNL